MSVSRRPAPPRQCGLSSTGITSCSRSAKRDLALSGNEIEQRGYTCSSPTLSERSLLMTSLPPTTRREFLLEASLSAVAVSALAGDVFASQQSATATGLPTRVLGRTPERVSIPGLGGWFI